MNIFTCSFALRYCLEKVDIIGMNAKKINTGSAGDCQEASVDNGNEVEYLTHAYHHPSNDPSHDFGNYQRCKKMV